MESLFLFLTFKELWNQLVQAINKEGLMPVTLSWRLRSCRLQRILELAGIAFDKIHVYTIVRSAKFHHYISIYYDSEGTVKKIDSIPRLRLIS